MAVRLRWVPGNGLGSMGCWIALCPVEHPQKERTDIDLNDAQDHALREKYLEDFKSEGLIKED